MCILVIRCREDSRERALKPGQGIADATLKCPKIPTTCAANLAPWNTLTYQPMLRLAVRVEAEFATPFGKGYTPAQ